jgi:hypothetical protein
MAIGITRRKFFIGTAAVGGSLWLQRPAVGTIADLTKFCRCDGSAEDDAIAKAMAQLPDAGGVIVLPPNPIVITRPVVIDKSRVTLAGFGPASRIITRGDIDGVVVKADRPLEHLLFSDFEIASEHAGTDKGSYGIRFQSSGVSYPEVRSVTIRSKFGGIAIDLKGEQVGPSRTVNAPRFVSVNVRDCYGVGLYASYLLDLFLADVHISMRRGFGRGLWISRWVQAVHATNLVCLGGEHGLVCENANDRAPSEIRFDGSVFDGATQSCVQIAAAARVRIARSWMSSALPGASAVIIDGPDAHDIELDDCDILNTARNGMLIGRSTKVRLLRSRVYNCSYEKVGEFDGVYISRDARDWRIESNTITNMPDYQGRQRFGIDIEAGAPGPYAIKSNRLNGNLAGGLNGAVPGGVRIVIDNIF